MKLSELITLLEEDKKRLWDVEISYIDFSMTPMFDWEVDEYWYNLH